MTDTLPNYTSGRAADWSLIPEHMIGGLRRYIEHGIPPGSFLTAVLSNDLCRAFEKADDINRTVVGDYVRFLYCYAPAGCWGSPGCFTDWCKQGGLTKTAA